MRHMLGGADRPGDRQIDHYHRARHAGRRAHSLRRSTRTPTPTISPPPSRSARRSACRWSCTAIARRPLRGCGSTMAKCWSLGKLRLHAIHTPGHTRDSMCLVVEDRVFTGDTLLIGGDRPHRSADRRSRTALRQPVHQAVEARSGARWSIRRTTTKAASTPPSAPRSRTIRACRKRERAAFIDMMRHLNLAAPDSPHRSAAHQYERRQDGDAVARRSRQRTCRSCRSAELNARIAARRQRSRRARRA